MIVYMLILRPIRQWIDFFYNPQQSTIICEKPCLHLENLRSHLKEGSVCVCVCVCVCVRVCVSDRDTGGEGARQRGLEVLFWSI